MYDALTPRERDVRAYLQRGAKTKAIAAELCISRFTVSDHIAAILRKTGTRSRFEAALVTLQLPLPF